MVDARGGSAERGRRRPLTPISQRGATGAEFRAHGLRLLGSSLGLGCGAALYTPVTSLFFRALEHEFHWSKAASAASLVALPITALAMPVIGWLLELFGVAAVAFASTLCLSVCLFGLSEMSGALAQFYVLFLAMSVLGAGTGPISYTRVIAHDFRNARGLALSLSLLGPAAVGVVTPLVVSHAMAAEGWRFAYRLLALVSLAGGVFAAILVRRRRLDEGELSPSPATGCSLAEAVRKRSFWLLGPAMFLITVASFGFASQLQSIGVEKGLSPSGAALIISLVSFSVMVARLAVGWALDVIDPRSAGAGALMLAGLGAAIVLLAPNGSLWGISFGAALFGGSLGAEFDLVSFFCAYCFGLKNYASIFGVLMAFVYTGVAVGGMGYGALHDHTGNYDLPLAASSAMLILAGALFLALPAESADSRPGQAKSLRRKSRARFPTGRLHPKP
jgi:MFS family permease